MRTANTDAPILTTVGLCHQPLPGTLQLRSLSSALIGVAVNIASACVVYSPRGPMKSILLIDGDQFIFKATAALERETQWDEHNHVLYSNAEQCWTNVTSMLDRIFERFDSKEHALCFTTSPNFRKDVDPTYKAGRASRKPLCYAALRERCDSEYNTIAMPGLEADDVMGILATKPGVQHKIIVSQDKDMKSIPATVWDGAELINVSEAEADYMHLYQTLIGDTSDGYKGCPGVGPKSAERVLAPEYLAKEGMTAWQSVTNEYRKKDKSEAEAIVQARLARILRWKDWDSDNKKPILWTPTPNNASPLSS